MFFCIAADSGLSLSRLIRLAGSGEFELRLLLPLGEFLGQEVGDLAGVHGREVEIEADLLENQSESLSSPRSAT